jgi:hypothetical protein
VFFVPFGLAMRGRGDQYHCGLTPDASVKTGKVEGNIR